MWGEGEKGGGGGEGGILRENQTDFSPKCSGKKAADLRGRLGSLRRHAEYPYRLSMVRYRLTMVTTQVRDFLVPQSKYRTGQP